MSESEHPQLPIIEQLRLAAPEQADPRLRELLENSANRIDRLSRNLVRCLERVVELYQPPVAGTAVEQPAKLQTES